MDSLREYGDKKLEVWSELLSRHVKSVQGGVVVDVGIGFGELSLLALEMGAKKVYIVERNTYKYDILKERFRKYKEVKVVKSDAMKFIPNENVDVFIHDFYGPLLYDTHLYILDYLPYRPRVVLPNEGVLNVSAVSLKDVQNLTDILDILKGVIVTGIFQSKEVFKNSYEKREVASWRYGRGLNVAEEVNVGDMAGEILLFYIEVRHNGRLLCDSLWPPAYTPKKGNIFKLKFSKNSYPPNVHFSWRL